MILSSVFVEDQAVASVSRGGVIDSQRAADGGAPFFKCIKGRGD